MNRLSRAGTAVALLAGVLWSGGVAEAGYFISPVTVCVDASSGVVSRVASSSKCVGGAQSWSASQSAPLLCWNASSLDPQVGTRKVSIAPSSGCAAPLRSVPVDKVLLLCAGGNSGVLRWPMTESCKSGNLPTWIRSASTSTIVATTSPTTSPTTALVVPSVSLTATWIQSITFPKAVTVTANVAGTIYFAEGAFVVKSVSDITSAPSYRWASGTVTSANTPTSIAIDVDALANGYYRVFVANSQGVLSAPATNIVTISVPRTPTAAEIAAGTTTTTVAVRTQTLDQSNPTWHTSGNHYALYDPYKLGQSFTAARTGPLSRISVGISRSGTVTQITASIYASDGTGNPTGSSLASKTIVGTTVPTVTGGVLTAFDFASPVSVTAETKYVIVLTTPDAGGMFAGSYRFGNSDGNSYTGGNGISRALTSNFTADDFVFQTYVDI